MQQANKNEYKTELQCVGKMIHSELSKKQKFHHTTK